MAFEYEASPRTARDVLIALHCDLAASAFLTRSRALAELADKTARDIAEIDRAITKDTPNEP